MRIDPARLAALLLEAPAWARVGLTMRDPRMRERAAEAIARAVAERAADQPFTPHPDQLALTF